MEKVEAYIKQKYGEFEEVFHEFVSPDIHCDIAVVPPVLGRHFGEPPSTLMWDRDS